jgi:hypothetical protein
MATRENVKQWMTEAGFPAVILERSWGRPIGIADMPDFWFNGYVGVPPEHPAFGRGYCDDLLDGICVHGGLTFAARSAEDDGWPEGFWWLGFDCNHGGPEDMQENQSIPRTFAECEKLAAQLKEVRIES